MSARREIADGVVNISRRQALKGSGLALAFLWLGGPGKALAAMSAKRQPGDPAAAAADGHPAFAPNAFIRIDAGSKQVRLVMPNVEMGQSIYTGTAMLLAEELGVDLDQVVLEHAPSNGALYGTALLGGEQATGGSTSTRNGWTVLRQAGAIGRMLLVQAAAARWHVASADCHVAHGEVIHGASGRRLGYGELAAAAGELPMPAQIQLKDPKDYTIIGKPWRRLDAGIKVDGQVMFGIDAKVPGMKIATVKSCPTFGGTLKSVDDSRARQIRGVIDIVKLDDAVAVIGEHFWAAKQGLDALDITWDPGPNAQLDTEGMIQAMAERSRHGTPIVGRQVGRTSGPGQRIESTYIVPMLAHATMEPLNATVHVTADKCSIWVGSQVPNRVVAAAARITGLPEDKIEFHNHYLGGGFGRRLEVDSVEQALQIAKRVDYPVKMVWTREQDIARDIVRPLYYDRIAANVDADGKPTYWHDRTTAISVMARWIPKAMGKNGLDSNTVEGAAEPPYDLPNLLSEWVPFDAPKGIKVGWWRGVGPTHNLFVVESFIDELAHAAGKDPLAYRRSLLEHGNPRTRAVLDLAAEKIGWGQGTLPPRVGRGIALGEPFGSHVCAIAEVEVSAQGSIGIRRVVLALDCGIAVNPSSIQAQMQGGLVFGLGTALFDGMTLKNGGFEQSNFNNYRMIRINETPKIEVYCVQSGEAPGGTGEVGTAIAAPAVANAVFAATGVRVRRLPIDPRALIRDEQAMKQVAAAAPATEEAVS